MGQNPFAYFLATLRILGEIHNVNFSKDPQSGQEICKKILVHVFIFKKSVLFWQNQ
jgi:hypothetical protein